MTKVNVPPIKIQGIKTKLIPFIAKNIPEYSGRWIEPFLGSGVVLFNVLPDRAIVSDINPHLINFYKAVQSKHITSSIVRDFLNENGAELLKVGEDHYYNVRKRFNDTHSPLDFLFLNRSCFNGMIRFNSKGGFNVPFCRKPERFRQAYVTKIVNQIEYVSTVMSDKDWVFLHQDWRETVKSLLPDDFIYLDPPYVGRHADYFNQWSDSDADDLAKFLNETNSFFAYSMWKENKYRKNIHLEEWFNGFPQVNQEHFYHLGASEALRNSMIETLVLDKKQVNSVNLP